MREQQVEVAGAAEVLVDGAGLGGGLAAQRVVEVVERRVPAAAHRADDGDDEQHEPQRSGDEARDPTGDRTGGRSHPDWLDAPVGPGHPLHG